MYNYVFGIIKLMILFTTIIIYVFPQWYEELFIINEEGISIIIAANEMIACRHTVDRLDENNLEMQIFILSSHNHTTSKYRHKHTLKRYRVVYDEDDK